MDSEIIKAMVGKVGSEELMQDPYGAYLTLGYYEGMKAHFELGYAGRRMPKVVKNFCAGWKPTHCSVWTWSIARAKTAPYELINVRSNEKIVEIGA